MADSEQDKATNITVNDIRWKLFERKDDERRELLKDYSNGILLHSGIQAVLLGFLLGEDRDQRVALPLIVFGIVFTGFVLWQVTRARTVVNSLFHDLERFAENLPICVHYSERSSPLKLVQTATFVTVLLELLGWMALLVWLWDFPSACAIGGSK